MDKDIASFILTLLHSGTNAHLLHLSTDSYAQHVALGDYYEEIIELVDDYAEAYQGRYDQIKEYPQTFHPYQEPLAYMQGIKEFIEDSREYLPNDTELMNIVDEIADLVNSTIYKLKFLK